ncbi:MAG: MmgE/PrpD family protein [Rhodospirillales bacterium]
MVKSSYPVSAPTKKLSDYMAGALKKKMPTKVVEKTKHHILDTLAAIISGTRLLPGERSIHFIKTQGGVKEATVIGSRFVTSAINAAFANAISAHADETDDSHFRANMHPGSVVVPAALAIAERQGSSGQDLMRAVALGYDIGARINMVIGTENMRRRSFDSHSFGGSFAAGAAAGSLLKLNSQQMRFVLSYAAQQTSGIRTWRRDPEHVEKAFDFSGMSARNGVTAALLVKDGFSGVDDVFDGDPNYFDIYVDKPKRSEFTDQLGKRFEIIYTNIKKWSVGSPVQSPLDAMEELMRTHKFAVDDIDKVVAILPTERVSTVDNRDMPDINLQHLLSLMILDGTVTFHSTHDYERMKDPKAQAMRRRISLKGSDMLTKARPGRQAIVEIYPKKGAKVSKRIRAVRGTADNPMTRAEVETKALDLIEPIIGKTRARKLVDAIWTLDKLKDTRKLRALLTA